MGASDQMPLPNNPFGNASGSSMPLPVPTDELKDKSGEEKKLEEAAQNLSNPQFL